VQPSFPGTVPPLKLLISATVREFLRIQEVPDSTAVELRLWQAEQPPLPAPSTESQ
jgi:hypothetical protein